MEAMGFAIDHSESSAEIVTVVVESLSLTETPVPTKIARLFLVSGIHKKKKKKNHAQKNRSRSFTLDTLLDILHNCTAAVPNASSYRSLYAYLSLFSIFLHSFSFETNLPQIFEHLNEAYRSITGRITAQNLKVVPNLPLQNHFQSGYAKFL